MQVRQMSIPTEKQVCSSCRIYQGLEMQIMNDESWHQLIYETSTCKVPTTPQRHKKLTTRNMSQ
jgi:hypothetical protein